MKWKCVAITFCTVLTFSANAANYWKHVGKIGKMDAVLINKNQEHNQNIYRQAASSVCSDKRWCKVLFWSDPDLIPKAFPMTKAQLKGQTASWTYNEISGFKKMLWACRIVNDPEMCFSH